MVRGARVVASMAPTASRTRTGRLAAGAPKTVAVQVALRILAALLGSVADGVPIMMPVAAVVGTVAVAPMVPAAVVARATSVV